jgi:fumarate hydratase subunit beta
MSGTVKRLTTPLSEAVIEELRAGMAASLSGVIYTARDAAHKRMLEALRRGDSLPFDPAGQVLYYVGPTPAPPGRVIGSAGPTTAARMDAFTLPLLERGLKGMIGKGPRSAAIAAALATHRAVYFAALGGAGALISECIKEAVLLAYEDLDAEAIRRLVVEDMPLIVANDCHGGDVYRLSRTKGMRREAKGVSDRP